MLLLNISMMKSSPSTSGPLPECSTQRTRMLSSCMSTMVNAFRASGIYPVNRQASNPKKLEPSMVHSSEPASSSSDASCLIKPGVGASKLALQALEEELNEATIRQLVQQEIRRGL